MSMAAAGGDRHIHIRHAAEAGGVLLHRRLAGAVTVIYGVGGEGGGIPGQVQGHALEVLVGEEGVLQGLNALVHHLHLGARAESYVHSDAAVIVAGHHHKFHLGHQQDGGQEAGAAHQHHPPGVAQQPGQGPAVEALEPAQDAVGNKLILGPGA